MDNYFTEYIDSLRLTEAIAIKNSEVRRELLAYATHMRYSLKYLAYHLRHTINDKPTMTREETFEELMPDGSYKTLLTVSMGASRLTIKNNWRMKGEKSCITTTPTRK